MRRLTFGMNVSLDGYIGAPDDNRGWREGAAQPCPAAASVGSCRVPG